MSGIRDNVVVLGVGCSKFGENWDKSADDMIVEAAYEAYADAGIEPQDIQAAWVGTLYTNFGGTSIARPLRLQHIPVSRIENVCASGMDAFRNACFGVASGMYDIVLVVGFEKLKDSGVRGLPAYPQGLGQHRIIGAGNTLPGVFALAATRYFAEYGIGRETLAKIVAKNRKNGSLCSKAYLQEAVTVEQILEAPLVVSPLSEYDCCPITDGASAAIIVSAKLAKSLGKNGIVVKGLGASVSPGKPQFRVGFDFLGWPATINACRQAYKQAEIKNPLKEISVAAIQDSFSIVELMSYEDLGFCEKGQAKDFVEAGVFSLGGELPVNTDGGLTAFGHPMGASGLRMIYEVGKQLQGKVENSSRQVKNAAVGLVHNLGGEYPNVSIVTILAAPQ